MWILIGYNFNFAVILRFREIQRLHRFPKAYKRAYKKAYKKHGIEIFESPNLNVKAKLKLYPNRIHIPELGPQTVAQQEKLISSYILGSGSKIYQWKNC